MKIGLKVYSDAQNLAIGTWCLYYKILVDTCVMLRHS